MTRFQMRIDRAWLALVLAGGATRNNSYVDVTPEAVTFHFGYAFNHTEDRDDITLVKERSWPWWAGIGWRSNLRGLVGLIGSYQGIVEVAFEGKSRAWGFLPLNQIAVSLEDPEGFIAALKARPAAATAKKAVAAPKARKAASKAVTATKVAPKASSRGRSNGRTAKRRTKRQPS
ncbi:MAG: hypothetical protein WD904_11045 [Dehalococcoidia bacterium]